MHSVFQLSVVFVGLVGAGTVPEALTESVHTGVMASPRARTRLENFLAPTGLELVTNEFQ